MQTDFYNDNNYGCNNNSFWVYRTLRNDDFAWHARPSLSWAEPNDDIAHIYYRRPEVRQSRGLDDTQLRPDYNVRVFQWSGMTRII